MTGVSTLLQTRSSIAILLFVFCVLRPSESSAQTSIKRSPNVIKFQVGYGRTLPVGLAQKWLATITKAGADGVRLVLEPNPKVRLQTDKQKSKTTIHVFAKIDRRHDLVVEGKSFGLSDTGELKAWIQNLRKLESTDPDQQPGAFGLTAQELVAIHGVLGKAYPKTTQGRPVSEIVRTIREQVGIRIGADTKALEALRNSDKPETMVKVPEELKGLSCGTVLAATIRPLGLVLVIQDKGRSMAIVDSRSADEHWPVGWPIQKRPSQIAPILFRQTEVEIEGFTLKEVLQAIEFKTKIPFVYDQNSMARHGIELDKIKVNLGRQKTFYDKLIRLCLNQSKPGLKSELRADEAGQPFLWISK